MKEFLTVSLIHFGRILYLGPVTLPESMVIICGDDDDDVETGPYCQSEKMAVRTYGPLRRGWRFSPNDEELIKYLREKNADELPEIEEIPDVDICKFEPEDLPGMKPFDDLYLCPFTIFISFHVLGGMSFHGVGFEFENTRLPFSQLQIFI